MGADFFGIDYAGLLHAGVQLLISPPAAAAQHEQAAENGDDHPEQALVLAFRVTAQFAEFVF